MRGAPLGNEVVVSHVSSNRLFENNHIGELINKVTQRLNIEKRESLFVSFFQKERAFVLLFPKK